MAVNEATAFGDLGLRKLIFMMLMFVYIKYPYFSPMHIGLRLRSVKFSASEVDLVLRIRCPTTRPWDMKIMKFSMKNHDFREFPKRAQDLGKPIFSRLGTSENHRAFANFVSHDS